MLRAWEVGNGPVPDLTVVIGRLTRLERIADQITEHLSAAALDTGRIVTFRTDDAASSAQGAQGISALHRICAGRAWEDQPDAQLVFHELDERDEPTAGDRRAELMVRVTMLGLNRADIKEQLGVERRRFTSWIRGDAPIPPVSSTISTRSTMRRTSTPNSSRKPPRQPRCDRCRHHRRRVDRHLSRP